MNKIIVWGGDDGLPSIDAECVATWAYLIHFGDLSKFEVLSGLDPSSSPNGEFPALSGLGGKYAGFSAIVDQIKTGLDESSDVEAYVYEGWCSFIQQKGQALIDLYLYASSANYWEFTSPTFTKLLPWYLNYIIPPTRRATAIARTKHLDVRSLDLDSIDEFAAGDHVGIGRGPTQPTSSFSATTSPEAMLKKQKSLKWFQTQQHSDTFRLFELTKAFFSPLEELLSGKNYLLHQDSPTKLDCVAIGYLSIIQLASVPQPWLREALQTRFPQLDAYTTRMYNETFQDVNKPWETRRSQMPIPTFFQATSTLSHHLFSLAFPAMKPVIYPQQADSKQAISAPNARFTELLTPAYLLPIGAVMGIALGVARYVSTSRERGATTLSAKETDFLAPTSLQDLGDSGAILSAFGQQMDLETQYNQERRRTGGATMVAVDVENEQGDVGRDIVIQK